jgi:hypothetical protein
MRRRKYIVGTIILAAAVIAGYFAYATRTASLSDEEWDICEAVLRHQIYHSAAAGRGTATAYMEVQGCNPTSAFLSRFRGHQPPVKAGWRFYRGSGVLYRIDGIKRTGEDSADVYGGYYEGHMSASGNTYYVVRKDGKWVVERDDMHWITQGQTRHCRWSITRIRLGWSATVIWAEGRRNGRAEATNDHFFDRCVGRTCCHRQHDCRDGRA